MEVAKGTEDFGVALPSSSSAVPFEPTARSESSRVPFSGVDTTLLGEYTGSVACRE